MNQNTITATISTLMQEYRRMPTKTEIAIKAELSRTTIHKHLKDYSTHPQYLGQIEQFKFMSSKVLAKVFYFAVNGDVKAAKLYLNMMGCSGNTQIQGNSTLIQNQNNYIQINNTLLTNEIVKTLSPLQLKQIEEIIGKK